MIWTVTPNPALDATYEIDTLRPGTVHRAGAPTVLPGGKGLNVSRVLAQRGIPTVATGFLGGAEGAEFVALLEEYPLIDTRFILTDVPTRRSISITDSHGGTVLNETGLAQSGESYKGLARLLRENVSEGDVVVISGSFPPGATDSEVRMLVTAAKEAGAVTLVDTSGPALAAAAAAGADVLKPNDVELEALTGTSDLEEGMAILLARGASLVVCSRGEEGMVAAHKCGTRVTIPVVEKIDGNPTGAGDSSVAGLATHLQLGLGPAEEGAVLRGWLTDAAALAGATVAWPTAGGFDEGVYERLKAESF